MASKSEQEIAADKLQSFKRKHEKNSGSVTVLTRRKHTKIVRPGDVCFGRLPTSPGHFAGMYSYIYIYIYIKKYQATLMNKKTLPKAKECHIDTSYLAQLPS